MNRGIPLKETIGDRSVNPAASDPKASKRDMWRKVPFVGKPPKFPRGDHERPGIGRGKLDPRRVWTPHSPGPRSRAVEGEVPGVQPETPAENVTNGHALIPQWCLRSGDIQEPSRIVARRAQTSAMGGYGVLEAEFSHDQTSEMLVMIWTQQALEASIEIHAIELFQVLLRIGHFMV